MWVCLCVCKIKRERERAERRERQTEEENQSENLFTQRLFLESPSEWGVGITCNLYCPQWRVKTLSVTVSSSFCPWKHTYAKLPFLLAFTHTHTFRENHFHISWVSCCLFNVVPGRSEVHMQVCCCCLRISQQWIQIQLVWETVFICRVVWKKTLSSSMGSSQVLQMGIGDFRFPLNAPTRSKTSNVMQNSVSELIM